MAHRMYDANRTMVVAADAMSAARAQQRRMLAGAAALRAATQNLATAIERRDAALERRDAARDRLNRARAARAALQG